MAAIFRDLARLLSRTSQPSGTAAGDLWWRSDLSQAHTSDGGTTPLIVGPTGNIPVIRAGGWHYLPPYGARTTLTISASFAHALPLWPGRACTFDTLAVEVTATTTGSSRHGLYSDSGGAPATLIQEFGTTSNTSTGVKTLATGIALKPILYWLVLVNQGSGTVSMRTHVTSSPFVSHLTTSFTDSHSSYYRTSFPGGTLPASFGTLGGATLSPLVLVQLT
jgi:hypothetical protein